LLGAEPRRLRHKIALLPPFPSKGRQAGAAKGGAWFTLAALSGSQMKAPGFAEGLLLSGQLLNKII